MDRSNTRRWFQISLRTLFLLTLVVAAFFGGVAFERRRAEARVVLDPGEIDFGRVEKGKPAERRINIYYAGGAELTIIDVRTDYEHLEAEIIHSEVEHADQLVVYLKDDAPIGEIDEELTILTNNPKRKRFTVRVRGQVKSPDG